jgi:hypothetical protein
MATAAESTLASLTAQYDSAVAAASAAEAAAESRRASVIASGGEPSEDAEYQALATKSSELNKEVASLQAQVYQATNDVKAEAEAAQREAETKAKESEDAKNAAPAETKKTAENKEDEDKKPESDQDNPTQQSLASGTTPANESKNADVKSGQKAGSGTTDDKESADTIKPKINPLSVLSSYTYAISLYMVTPETMNKFTVTGSLNGLKGKNKGDSGDGVYVVAQSGGINNSVEDRLLTIDHKLGGGREGYDYYIDNLQLQTLLPGGENRASVSTSIKFKIIEPNSFVFLQDIARGAAELNARSILLKSLPDGRKPNGFNQHFILGIKFYGYDVNGEMITSASPGFSEYSNGDKTDPASVINRYFAIKFSDMKFKIDGKTVVYDCEALVIAEQAAYGKINATIKKDFTISGSTVGDVINGDGSGITSLATVLNNEKDALLDRKLVEAPGKVAFEFINDAGKVLTNSEIAAAGLINDATYTAATSAISVAKTTNEVTIADSVKSNGIDKSKKTISVAHGQNILNVLDNIIVKSNYITDALKAIADENVETTTIAKAVTKKLKWYTVNPVVEVGTVDKVTGLWKYDITYQIKPFMIPYIRTNKAGLTSKYPGPYKQYKYWFTGENSEVTSYTQQYDNLFYTVNSMSTDTSNSAKAEGGAPAAPSNGSASDQSSGAQNKGSMLNDEVRAQLYSPSDQSSAKITILGDPDYIMTGVGVRNGYLNKFHSKDGSISPFGTQVFIEMSFNMSTDYTDNGVLDVTDQLQFYKTDRTKKAGIQGIVYMVNSVESTFNKGAFTQVLDCLLVMEDKLVTGDASVGADQRATDGNNSDGTGTIKGAGDTKSAKNQVQSGRATTNSSGKPSAPAESSTEVRDSNVEVPPPDRSEEETSPTEKDVLAAMDTPNNTLTTTNGVSGVDDDAKVYTGATDYYDAGDETA